MDQAGQSEEGRTLPVLCPESRVWLRRIAGSLTLLSKETGPKVRVRPPDKGQ